MEFIKVQNCGYTTAEANTSTTEEAVFLVGEKQKMSVSGTFLVMITASFLKPLLSTNQSLQLPAANVYSNVSPFAENNVDSDGVPNVFLTLRLPQLLTSMKDFDFDKKRQFDPWGGKRQSKPPKRDENAGRKRQFSPWGGKRSFSKSFRPTDDNLADVNARLFELLLKGDKRNFNSWGGKRGFNSWGGKRNSNSDSSARFNSWGGKRNFNSWGGKRNFNAWGGKRFINDVDRDSGGLAFVPKMNANLENKRQSFNAWGGKRSFNSWGGKRKFNSWGGKPTSEVEQEPKELNISEVSFPQTYKDKPIEETERSIV